MVIQIDNGDFISFNHLSDGQLGHILSEFPAFEDYAKLHDYLCNNCAHYYVTSNQGIELTFGVPDCVDIEEWEELFTELRSYNESN